MNPFFFIKEDGLPLLVEVYTDGRVHAEASVGMGSLREFMLFVNFHKCEKRGKFESVPPGCYALNFLKVGLRSYTTYLEKL